MFGNVLKNTNTRLKNVYANFKEYLTNNPPKAVLYLFAVLGVSATQVENWLTEIGADWFVALNDWVASVIEPLPIDVAPMTFVGGILALVGAKGAGKFAQRFTEPRKAYDAILHKYLNEWYQDVEEDESA